MGFVAPGQSRAMVVIAGGKRAIETEVTGYVCIYVYVYGHCQAGGLSSVL